MHKYKSRFVDWVDTVGMDIPGTSLSSFIINQNNTSASDSFIEFKSEGSTPRITWKSTLGRIQISHPLYSSSDLSLISDGELKLKDSRLSSSINFSESGVDSLENYTASSIIGALNEVKLIADSSAGTTSWRDPIQHPNQLENGTSGGIRSAGAIIVTDYSSINDGDTIVISGTGSNFTLTAKDSPDSLSGQFKSKNVSTSNSDTASSIMLAINNYTSASAWSTYSYYDSGDYICYLIYNVVGSAGNGIVTLSGNGLSKRDITSGLTYSDVKANQVMNCFYDDMDYVWNTEVATWVKKRGDVPDATTVIKGKVSIGSGLLVNSGSISLDYGISGSALTVSRSDHSHSDLHTRQHSLSSSDDHTGQLGWSQVSNLAGTSSSSFSAGDHTHSDIAGTNSNQFTINMDNVSADKEDAYIVFERGSSVPNAYLKWDVGSSHFYMNFPLEVNSTSDLKLIMKDSTNSVSLLTGVLDPSSVEVNADIGSLYINSSTAEVWKKVDDGSSLNWIPLGGLVNRFKFTGSQSIDYPTNKRFQITSGTFMSNAFNLWVTVNGIMKSKYANDFIVIDTQTIEFNTAVSNTDIVEMLILGSGGTSTGHVQNSDLGTDSTYFRIGTGSTESAEVQSIYFGNGLVQSQHGFRSNSIGLLEYRNVGDTVWTSIKSLGDAKSLDSCYNSGGSGLGREITLSNGALKLSGDVRSKIEFNDSTDLVSLLVGRVNPVSTLQEADTGSVFIRSDSASIYQKQDDGATANWKEIVFSGSNTTLTSITGLTGDIRWGNDGEASIGTSTNYRPNNIYAKNIIAAQGQFRLGTSTAYIEQKYAEYTLTDALASFSTVGAILIAQVRSMIVDYQIIRGTAYEVGTLYLVHDGTLGYVNINRVSSSSVGVTFDADYNSPNLRLLYKTTDTGSSAILKVNVRYFLN